jgi:hypothetical protein
VRHKEKQKERKTTEPRRQKTGLRQKPDRVRVRQKKLECQKQTHTEHKQKDKQAEKETKL